MKSEEKIKIGVVEFSIVEEKDYLWFTRMYIPPEHREKHLAVPALKKMILFLSDRGKNIYGSVMPDIMKGSIPEKVLDSEYEKIRHILGKAGFAPDPEYRNDLTYYY